MNCCFTAHLLPCLLSCGDHFNPDGTSHGGPQDAHRVSAHLGEAWAERAPKFSEAEQAALQAALGTFRLGEIPFWTPLQFLLFPFKAFVDAFCVQGLPPRHSQSCGGDHRALWGYSAVSEGHGQHVEVEGFP